jgi:hypothetical protein
VGCAHSVCVEDEGMIVRLRAAMILVLLLGACGSTDEDPDLEGTDLDTTSDTDSGTDAEADTNAEADTDSETVDLSRCQSCVENSFSFVATCSRACVNEPTFCHQQMCRFACEDDSVQRRLQCLDNFAECSDAIVLAECEESCRDTWSACTSGSPCPQGNSGNCQDRLFECMGDCN